MFLQTDHILSALGLVKDIKFFFYFFLVDFAIEIVTPQAAVSGCMHKQVSFTFNAVKPTFFLFPGPRKILDLIRLKLVIVIYMSMEIVDLD